MGESSGMGMRPLGEMFGMGMRPLGASSGIKGQSYPDRPAVPVYYLHSKGRAQISRISSWKGRERKMAGFYGEKEKSGGIS